MSPRLNLTPVTRSDAPLTLAPIVGLATFMAIPLSAWADQPPTADDQDALALPDSTVQATQESPYKVDHASSAKYSEPLRDTPQSVTVLSETLLKEQNAQSLKDALRNVPGITFNSGEGGGGVGDSLTIRGFNADGNIYRDGVRDPACWRRYAALIAAALRAA